MSDSTSIWMPFYPGDYLADTQHLTTELHGAYMLLLMAYWTRQGPLRDADHELAQICRMPIRRWLSARPTLAAFFDIQEGFWIQGRCEREIAESKRIKDVAKARAKKGNEARWGRPHGLPKASFGDPSRTPHGIPNGTSQGLHKESQNHRSSPSPSPSPENSPPPPPSPEASPGDCQRLGDGAKGDRTEAQEPAPLDQVEAIWAIWPKKIDTMQAMMAIRHAIGRHGFDPVLQGVSRIVEADRTRKSDRPGRFLPKPTEFFEGDRFLDDPAQYAQRMPILDVQGLRRRVEDLEGQFREHPGNPGNTEGSLERKREARESWLQLNRDLREARAQLGQVMKEAGQ